MIAISKLKIKKFKIFFNKNKRKNKTFELNVIGSLNTLNQKINFKSISVNNVYDASKEDLLYFKDTYERIIIDENLISIFNKKIKEFIQEVS